MFNTAKCYLIFKLNSFEFLIFIRIHNFPKYFYYYIPNCISKRMQKCVTASCYEQEHKACYPTLSGTVPSSFFVIPSSTINRFWAKKSPCVNWHEEINNGATWFSVLFHFHHQSNKSFYSMQPIVIR